MPFRARILTASVGPRHILTACCAAGIALAGCARPPQAAAPAAATNEPSAPAPASAADAPPPAAPARETVAARDVPPAAQASLPEPGPAAINTAQAAATAVETYFALLEAGRTTDADAMWGDAAQGAKFRSDFAALGEYHAEVGAPGGVEGAAGSMYVTVPLRLLPAPSVSNPRPRMGEVVVRRVNDVPGSTEAQRRWHIERIDVAMTPK
jgi:hypothetical protein